MAVVDVGVDAVGEVGAAVFAVALVGVSSTTMGESGSCELEADCSVVVVLVVRVVGTGVVESCGSEIGSDSEFSADCLESLVDPTPSFAAASSSAIEFWSAVSTDILVEMGFGQLSANSRRKSR